MKPLLVSALSVAAFLTSAGAAFADPDASLLSPEEEVQRSNLRDQIERFIVPPERNPALVKTLNALVPGTGTMLDTGDGNVAASEGLAVLILSGLATGVSWYTLKDNPTFKQYDLAVSLPALMVAWDAFIAFGAEIKHESAHHKAVAVLADLQTSLRHLDAKEEEERAARSKAESAFEASFEDLLAKNSMAEARSLLTGEDAKVISSARRLELEGQIGKRQEENQRRAAASLREAESLAAGKQLREAIDVLDKILPGTAEESHAKMMKESLQAKIEAEEASQKQQAAEAQLAAKKAEAAARGRLFDAMYSALKAGQTGAAMHAIADLEQKMGVQQASIEADDVANLIAGKCSKDEPLLLRGRVIQVLADGYLMEIGDDDTVYVQARRNFNLVDNNAVVFGAVYKGTVSYTTVWRVKKTVRCVEIRSKLEAW